MQDWGWSRCCGFSANKCNALPTADAFVARCGTVLRSPRRCKSISRAADCGGYRAFSARPRAGGLSMPQSRMRVRRTASEDALSPFRERESARALERRDHVGAARALLRARHWKGEAKRRHAAESLTRNRNKPHQSHTP
eukprot:6209724-Pleurochrysis_carterae.AAC.2